MKKIVLFLFVLVILCGFSSVSSNAAEKGGEVKRCTETVYKGQKRLLLYSDEDGIARIDEDAWTIKSGKKNIKLCDGGKYIKGFLLIFLLFTIYLILRLEDFINIFGQKLLC